MTGTSEGAKKAAETRKSEDPHAFEKMGAKGGAQSHEGSSDQSSSSDKNRSQNNNNSSKSHSSYSKEDKDYSSTSTHQSNPRNTTPERESSS